MDLVDIGLKLTYILIGLGVVAAILMPLFYAATQDPKSLLKVALGLGFLIIVYFIGFGMSGDEVTARYTEFGIDSVLSKRIGGLLISMYLLMILALVGIVFTEISKLVK